MKRKLLIAMLVTVTGVFLYACQDNTVSDSSSKNGNDGARILACPPIVTLSGTINTNRTLYRDTLYKLSGVVQVASPRTLTIQSGTNILGIKNATTPAFLIIRKGAQINAAGTSTSPIIFSSDQAVNSRAPGDWGGLVLEGDAPNNQSNALAIYISGTTYTAGGSNAASSVGTVTYTQINYAGFGGGAGSDRKSEGSLILNSAGSGSTFHHIQVSYSKNDGVSVFGGSAKMTYMFNVNVQRTDFVNSYGYVGIQQFVGAIKLANVVSPATTYGMEISNVLLSETTTAIPQTYPTYSNVTLMGGNYCGTGDTDILHGIYFNKNGNGRIYNSVISSFAGNGLFLDGNQVVANTTAANPLQFSYNSFHNIASPYFNFSASGTWGAAGGCGVGLSPSMTQWLTGAGVPPCSESGNQFTVATLGYNSSFCSNYCSSFTPNFILGTTTLSASNFGWDPGNVFDHPAYRGAYETTTSWVTNAWADLCPQSKNFCP